MFSTRGIRVALGIAVVGVMALGSGLFAPLNASAATKPTVVVTPAKNLKNNEVVKISGKGFTPGDSVFVVECLAHATGESSCSLANLVPVTISATGTFPKTSFKVITGKIGTGYCGTKKTNLASCAVSVGNAAGKDSAVGKIVFK